MGFGKNVISDIAGTSDIAKFVSKEDFNKIEVDDYIFHEDDEQIIFALKSSTDEYLFTNKAFIHFDGEKATSTKRLLKRYTWTSNYVTDVEFESSGRVDLDAEIKFKLTGIDLSESDCLSKYSSGEIKCTEISIDIDKKEIEKIKDIYKSLFKIHSIQKEMIEKLINIRKLLTNNRLSSFETIEFAIDKIENSIEEFKEIDYYECAFENYLEN